MLKRLKRKIEYLFYSRIKNMDDSDINILHLKKQGVRIGEGCRVFTRITTTEPTLITIGDRVTISSEVSLCTHDNAVSKVIEGKTDIVGRISIGNDCFVGMRSLLMYGVSIGDHCIVAAGSVVTKSFPSQTVLGGNPAKKICTTDEYVEKYKDFAIDFSEVPMNNREEYFDCHPDLMVER